MTKHPKITIAAGSPQVHHRYLATIAKDRGYFDEEGLTEVDIITANHNADNLFRKMLAGSVHIGLDAMPRDVLRWITQEGADIYLIGGYKNHVNMDLIGAKGIRSIADLKGKRFGLCNANWEGLDGFQAKVVIESAKLDPDKDVILVGGGVEIHPLVGDPVAVLKRGEVDAVFVWYTETSKLEAEGYPVLVRLNEFYPGGYPDRTMISTGTVINQYPATITAFLKGMIRAHRFYRDMPRNLEYMVDLDKRMRAADDDPEEKAATNIGMNAEILARDPHPIDGRLPLEGLEVILAQQKKAGKIPESFTLNDLVKREFVEQANKELDAREDLQEEYQRVKQIVERYGF